MIIDEFNSTDFALEVFNTIRDVDHKLLIPKYDIPGGMAPFGTSIPQGLFNLLTGMKKNGSSEASNILIPGYKGWVTNSKSRYN